MAVQAAIPSHGGEIMAVFIKDADEKLFVPASNCLGMKCRAAARMEIAFESTIGTLQATVASLTVNDDDGIGFKKAMQAVANAMGTPARVGTYVKIADTSTGEFIHQDITAVHSIS